jgi:hypothetical protein
VKPNRKRRATEAARLSHGFEAEVGSASPATISTVALTVVSLALAVVGNGAAVGVEDGFDHADANPLGLATEPAIVNVPNAGWGWSCCTRR